MSQAAPTKQDVPNLEAAKVLLSEWQIRHQHGWNSLQRFGLAAVTVSIIPYLKTDLFKVLGSAILVFPIVAWLLALAAGWHFAAEYVRCVPVQARYYQLLGEYCPERFTPQFRWQEVLARKVGWTTILVFVIGFTVLSIANGIVLWNLRLLIH